MDFEVFAVYDSKSDCYKWPRVSNDIGSAVRGFAEAANDEQTEIGKYPADFTLMHLGSLGEISGVLIPKTAPVNMGIGSSFVKKGGKK